MVYFYPNNIFFEFSRVPLKISNSLFDAFISCKFLQDVSTSSHQLSSQFSNTISWFSSKSTFFCNFCLALLPLISAIPHSFHAKSQFIICWSLLLLHIYFIINFSPLIVDISLLDQILLTTFKIRPPKGDETIIFFPFSTRNPEFAFWLHYPL